MPGASRGGARPAALIVLSDIEADPDDFEGRIVATAVHMEHGVHPDSMRRIVGQYGKVGPNLLLLEPGFPTATVLLSRIRSGQPDFGIAAVGQGKDKAKLRHDRGSARGRRTEAAVDRRLGRHQRPCPRTRRRMSIMPLSRTRRGTGPETAHFTVQMTDKGRRR